MAVNYIIFGYTRGLKVAYYKGVLLLSMSKKYLVLHISMYNAASKSQTNCYKKAKVKNLNDFLFNQKPEEEKNDE
jgi:hypothetical protein